MQGQITGTGHYLPRKILSNSDLESLVDTSSEWIMERVGIEQRHIAADGETASDMAVVAAQQALEAAQLQASDIDLIIVATSTPDNIFPSTACLVQHRLGVPPCAAFDLSAACSGWVYALHVANQFIKSGQSRHALIIGSEAMSRLMNWRDRSTCVLFGDGAGAVVLAAGQEPGLLSTHVSADGAYAGLLQTPNILPGQHTDQDKPYLRMQGPELFKKAVNTLGRMVSETLQQNGIQQEEIDWLIPHQANRRIIEATAKKMNLSMEQVVLTLPNQGNTSCASIPIALDTAIRDGRIHKGDLLLLETFGGGLTWGAALLRY